MSLEKDIALLREVAIFDILNGEALRILAISAEQRHLAQGEVLFKAGEKAECGYVLGSGVIHLVERDAVTGREHVLQVVERGALIGETALVMETARPVTAVAARPCELMRISRSTFLRMLEGYPEAARQVRRHFANRLRSMMRALDKVRLQLEEARPNRRG